MGTRKKLYQGGVEIRASPRVSRKDGEGRCKAYPACGAKKMCPHLR